MQTTTTDHKHILLSLLFVFITTGIQAQIIVSGIVQDVQGEALPYASVLLLDSKDSSLVKGQISKENGAFLIETKKAGSYFIFANSVGYEPTYSNTFFIDQQSSPKKVGALVIKESIKELTEVVIQAERPLFEQQIDRTVINVGSNIAASGGTALEILQRSPGVIVDQMNSTISLSGKQGVRIMLNGKLMRMPQEALVQLLAGTNAESVEKIELITTPPASYEAEGDAGIINIVMKKNLDNGLNGSASIFAGY